MIILHRSKTRGEREDDTRLYEFLQQLRGFGTKLVYPRREDSLGTRDCI